MVRYARQRDDSTDCGPIAILNALKWAGEKCSMRETLPLIIEKSRCGRDAPGVFRKDFGDALCYFGRGKFTATRVLWPRIDTMEQFLRDPSHAVITDIMIITSSHERRRHLLFMTDVSESGKSFLCVNYRKRETLSWVTRRTIIVGHQEKCYYGEVRPVAWLLSKEV